MLDKEQVRHIAHKYVDVVRQEYDPLRVILFGSFVNGNPHEYSDIDIAVIFKDYKGDWEDTWTRLFKLVWQVDLSIEPHMMDDDYDPSGFLEHVYKTGEIIYEKGAGS